MDAQHETLTVLVVASPTAPHLRLLRSLPQPTRVVIGEVPSVFNAVAPSGDVLLNCGSTMDTLRNVWRMAPELRWVHSLSAGVENCLFPELTESDVPLTCGRGVFARALAEFVFGAALYFDKDFQRLKRQQAAAQWETFDVNELHGKTMGIVGYGRTGRAVAKLARGFGMKVLAVRRRVDDPRPDPLVDGLYDPQRTVELAGCSDFVVIAAPLTPLTRGLIGEAEIRAMKPETVVINVGRGPVVDEPALIAALQERRIRGAALDVFDEEPLPAGHPYYRMENVLLSPHSADHTRGWRELPVKFFLENFQRFVAGEPLRNLVDKESGY